MSSNAPRQQFAQVHLSHGLFRVPSLVRCTAGRGEMAAHWHKSGMKKISSLSYCCTGSAKCCVRTTAKSQKHPEAFHFRRKSNPTTQFEMASGLLQVSSPSVEKCLPWSHVRFHWGWGGVPKHLPIQFQSALLLLQSADKSID
jgi:hypothetical protein